MKKYILAGLLALSVMGLSGCKSGIGGPEIDNKTNTFANEVELRNLNNISNPTPSR